MLTSSFREIPLRETAARQHRETHARSQLAARQFPIKSFSSALSWVSSSEMAGSGGKRRNAQLEKSYSKATGIKDDRERAFVDPTRVIEWAFLLLALRAINNQVESTHGVSPWGEGKKVVGSAIRRARSWLARIVNPGYAGSGGRNGRGNVNSKKFKGKGRKVGGKR